MCFRLTRCNTMIYKHLQIKLWQPEGPPQLVFGISVKDSEIEIFKNYTCRRLYAEKNSAFGVAEVFDVLQLLLMSRRHL